MYRGYELLTWESRLAGVAVWNRILSWINPNLELDAEEVSREAAQEITAAVDIPVVAIGGINKKNILELKGTGVDGVALVSAIFGAENIEEECKTLKTLSAEMVQA